MEGAAPFHMYSSPHPPIRPGGRSVLISRREESRKIPPDYFENVEQASRLLERAGRSFFMPNGFYVWYKGTIRDLKNKVLPNRSQIATTSSQKQPSRASKGRGNPVKPFYSLNCSNKYRDRLSACLVGHHIDGCFCSFGKNAKNRNRVCLSEVRAGCLFFAASSCRTCDEGYCNQVE